jgi:hypothetical protein
MSGPGIASFDYEPTEEQLASEMREPPPRPMRRDRHAEAAAWMRTIDVAVKRSERQTMRALTSAVGQAMKDERAEVQKTIIALRSEIAELQLRLATLEEQRARLPFIKVVDAA